MMSENIGELSMALAKAQGEIKAAVKDSTNPAFRSKYADLNSVINAIKDPMSRNELAYMQIPHEIDGITYLVTIISHKSGQFVKSQIPIKVKSDVKFNEIQETGKAITYLKRYVLSAMLGVSSDEDDDGNSSVGYTAESPKVAPKVQTISKEQVAVLNGVLQKCPADYVKQIEVWLKNQNIDSINVLPLPMFENLLITVNTTAKGVQNGKQQPSE